MVLKYRKKDILDSVKKVALTISSLYWRNIFGDKYIELRKTEI